MSIPTLPITFMPVTERPGNFGFFATSTNINDELDGRVGSNVEWSSMLPLGVWSRNHWKTIEVVNGKLVTALTAADLPLHLSKTDGADADTLIDCLLGATPFRYEIRQAAPTLELTTEQLREQVANRLMRSHDLAFSFALAQRLEQAPVEVAAGLAEVPDAIAILDDELMNRGIYGGVIHVPGYLSARIKADLNSDETTWNGTRIHLMPSTVLTTQGEVYATGPVHYAMSEDHNYVVAGDGDASAANENFYSNNDQFAQGSYEGLVAFDGPALSISTQTVDTLTTGV